MLMHVTAAARLLVVCTGALALGLLTSGCSSSKSCTPNAVVDCSAACPAGMVGHQVCDTAGKSFSMCMCGTGSGGDGGPGSDAVQPGSDSVGGTDHLGGTDFPPGTDHPVPGSDLISTGDTPAPPPPPP